MPEGPPGLGGHFRLAGLPRVVWGGRCPLGRCPLVAGRPMIPVAAVCPAPGGGRRGEPIAAADEVPVGPSLIGIAVRPAPSVSCSVCPRVQVRPGDVRPVISGRHETRPVQIGLTPATLIGQGVAGPFVGATSRRGLRRAIFPGAVPFGCVAVATGTPWFETKYATRGRLAATPPRRQSPSSSVGAHLRVSVIALAGAASSVDVLINWRDVGHPSRGIVR